MKLSFSEEVLIIVCYHSCWQQENIICWSHNTTSGPTIEIKRGEGDEEKQLALIGAGFIMIVLNTPPSTSI
jgi:hypothetical protein